MIDEKKMIEELNNYCGSQKYLISQNVWNIINNQPKVGEWIPVSDQPKESKSYLIQCKTDMLSDEFGIHKARYSVNTEKWKSSEGNAFFEGVVAWMPLPEPYKGE